MKRALLGHCESITVVKVTVKLLLLQVPCVTSSSAERTESENQVSSESDGDSEVPVTWALRCLKIKKIAQSLANGRASEAVAVQPASGL